MLRGARTLCRAAADAMLPPPADTMRASASS